RELRDLPRSMERLLGQDAQIARLANLFQNAGNALYLGRGIHYPLAVEGALKLKEISYIHAEGYPAGELKHGPIALIDRDMPIVAIAPLGRLYGKVMAALGAVRARAGRGIGLASR